MITDKEYQLENMSFRDMASLFLNSSDLDALITAMDEQETLATAYGNQSMPCLKESIDDLRQKDPKVAIVFVEEISNIIKSKALKPEDIPKLVHSISYTPEMQAEIQSQYSQKGMMSWTEFGINIHSGAMAKKEDGTPVYNIGHFFDHEISHSLVEAGAITIGQIASIFEGTNIKFESKHIQSLTEKDADQELLLKERFCEISGCYLQSLGDQDHLTGFLNRMMMNCSSGESTESDSDLASEMFGNFKMIYDRLEQVWPSMSQSVNELSLEEVYDMVQSGPAIDFDLEETAQAPMPEQTPDLSRSGDSGSDETLKNMKPRTFEETSDLGKNDKTESFARTTQHFLRDFTNTLDFFNGSPS